MATLSNVLLFQLGWFACVIGAAKGNLAIGPMVAAGVIAVHFTRLGHRMWIEARIVGLVTVAGALADSALMRLGALGFADGTLGGVLCPVWMMALWAIFATLLNSSLSWMRKRYVLGTLFGAVGGPLSYFAGQRLGALNLHPPIAWSGAAVSLEWAIAMPAMLWLAARIGSPDPQTRRAIAQAVQR